MKRKHTPARCNPLLASLLTRAGVSFTPLRPAHSPDPYTALAASNPRLYMQTEGKGWLTFHVDQLIARCNAYNLGNNTTLSDELRPEWVGSPHGL